VTINVFPDSFILGFLEGDGGKEVEDEMSRWEICNALYSYPCLLFAQKGKRNLHFFSS
jgi:hypothetical protein